MLLPLCTLPLSLSLSLFLSLSGFSMVTNVVILELDSDAIPPSHQEVMDTANTRAKDLQLLVKTIVGKLASTL